LNQQIFKVYTNRQLDKIEALQKIPQDMLFSMQVVANALPFRVNSYVINELIDWDNIPEDPIFQLVFPQQSMLEQTSYERMASLLKQNPTSQEVKN